MRTPLTYCDPPYAASSRLEPAKGYRHDDDGDLWERLVAVLADVRHAAVILSGYPCPEADGLGWRTVSLTHARSVQARAAGTLSAAPETLWLSPAVADPIPCLLTQGHARNSEMALRPSSARRHT